MNDELARRMTEVAIELEAECPVPGCIHFAALDGTFTDLDWRLLCLLELGFPVQLAEELAGAGVGEHDAKPLIEAGATFEQAAKLLL